MSELPKHRDDDDLLDNDEMAEVRRVPPSRLHKERLFGGPDCQPYIKDRHLVRYRWGDYKAWLASRRRYNSTSELAA